ncbi:DNA polymerase III subunit gamma and tau [Kocuria varians]
MSETPAKVSCVTTALYRRYRPETFQDVIGQEHVTEPLMTALRKNRVNHAYLFSGPRGCGKTTSARILARCLNCAEGPTATPCGRCESCRDLARDGAGSLDVIEMDAASHGGVDHARDLRERATFAPVRDRYKIFIIDEAHMVTREGFNALLKIVEEPPEHVKFIFATTEPSKVLTTIRSRTHHYPFRLVPPEPLMRYLEQLCQEEGVTTEPGVLSLVVRAGGGSVRDSLSVLDQLMAGSDDGGITYDLAVALLGYTHAALLDDVVDAFAAGDAATVFASVDRVIQTGQDPRRFVEDLLERFRDLVVVNAVPDAADNILHGMPTDQINRLRNQSTQLGAAELSRSADIINEALNEMTGATSPQLHLELLCARILLPSADHTTRGITSRVDRLERRLSIPRGAGIRSGSGEATPSAPAADVEPTGVGSPVLRPTSPSETSRPAAAETSRPEPVADEPRRAPAAEEAITADAAADENTGASLPVAPDGSALDGSARNGSAQDRPGPQGTPAGRPAEETPDAQEPTDPQDESEEPEGSAHPAAGDPVPEGERGPQAEHPPADGVVDGAEDAVPASPAGQAAPHQAPEVPHEQSAPSDVTSGELELLRSSWPEIVSALAEIRRVAWAITVRGTPISYENDTLRIAFEGDGDILNFPRFEADVRNAIQTVVGLACGVEAVRPGDTQGRSGGGGQGGPTPGNGGRGPGRPSGGPPRQGRGPGNRGEASRQQDPAGQPDYFREPEGFGVNRRHGGPQESSAPQTTRTTPADEPPADDDEPVTSWSVASIPQPGSPADEPRSSPAHEQEESGVADPEQRAESGEPGRVPSGIPEGIGAGTPSGADGSTGPVAPGETVDGRSPENATVPVEVGRPEDLGRSVDSTESVDTVSADARSSSGTDSTTRAATNAPSAPSASAARSGLSEQPPSARPAADGPARGQDGPARSGTAPNDDAPSGDAASSSRGGRGPGGSALQSAPAAPDRGPEYWSPDEPPPPPEEDEPPADMYDAPLTRQRPTFRREAPAPQQTDDRSRGGQGRSGVTTASSASPSTQTTETPGGAPGTSPDVRPGTGGSRPGWRERHAAAIAAASAANGQSSEAPGNNSGRGNAAEDENFVPGADDESLEDSSLYGRAAIERILGGMLIDERAHDAHQ